MSEKEIIIEKIHQFCFSETLKEKKDIKKELESLVNNIEIGSLKKSSFKTILMAHINFFDNKYESNNRIKNTLINLII